MKIAIQGHSTRGKEVIQILESLGGKNEKEYIGDSTIMYYFIDICKNIDMISKYKKSDSYKYYTLEEFEKEFPFKIGDKVIFKDKYHSNPPIYTITGLEFFGDELSYLLDDLRLHFSASKLELHKPMKEERNITLTLDKAREWYKKGGELKEIALQAFTEKELNPLPKSWEEYCKMYPIQAAQCLSVAGCPKKYIALWKLEQLRDCYRQGWEPNWAGCNPINSIYRTDKEIGTTSLYSPHFLSFQSEEVAREFLKNFEPLIKEAGNLI